MPYSDDTSSCANTAPLMTAVEVEPPSRHRWRQNPLPNYAWLPPGPTPPEDVLFRKDIENDDVGIQALFESLTNRQTMLFIQQALRTIIFVSLPMYTLANHPNTMYRLGFPQLLVATVVSTSTHQGFLGQQIGMHLFILRGVVFMMLLGLFFSSWGVTHHIGAWWGLFAAAMFLANLVKHSILRRFMVLYTLIWMMEIRLSDQYYGYTTITNSCWFAADFMIGSCLGVAAMILPVPLYMHTVVDGLFAKTYTGLGKYLVSMQTFVLSANTHAAENFFANKNPLLGVEKILAQAPSLLWFSNWEPTEFATRNPIRVVKLSLLRRLLALTYAAQSCGEVIVRLRREQADRVALQRHRDRVRRLAGRCAECDSSDNEDDDNGDAKTTTMRTDEEATPSVDATDPLYHNARFVEETRRREGRAAAQKLTHELQRLHKNSVEYATAFGTALDNCMGLIGTTDSRPRALVKAVPFEDLIAKDVLKRRNMRMETLFVRHCQANHINRHRRERAKRQDSQTADAARKSPTPPPRTHDAAAEEEEETHAYPAETLVTPVQHEPFRTREEEADEPFTDNEDGGGGDVEAVRAVSTAHHDERRDPYYISPEDAAVIADFCDVLEDHEVALRLNELFFHLLLSMIAGEIQTFSEMMMAYKPAHSLPYRLWIFFIIQPWNDFWNELWHRITLARPCDVRTIKNAVQMTAAYLAASAFNLELWKPDNVFYFFGTTIVLGMPVGEEALTQGVTRLAGNTLGCALGYLSLHNTKNLSETIGFSLCLCFICLLCQHHPIFGPCFIYGAIITLAGTPMAQNNDDILQRTMSIAWAFCAFMLVCMLVFPSSNIKILWNHRSKMVKIISEVIDGVADLTRQPIVSVDLIEDDVDDKDSTSGADLSVRATAAKTDAMLSQLHLNTQLAKGMSASCVSWGPIAARENMIRGSLPFPSGPSTQVQAGLQRLLAEMQLLVFGAQLIHRPRLAAADPVLQSIISGPLADFLDEFSGLSRVWAQGFVDSLQNSRRWSYPKALNDTSYLTRLKARLRTILFQVLALMNAPMVQGMAGLEAGDFDDIDGDARRLAEATKKGPGGGSPSAAAAAAAAAAAEAAMASPQKKKAASASDGDAAAPDERDGVLHNSFASTLAMDPHASFAGRYLAARRQLGDLDEAAVRGAAREGRLPNDTIVSTAGGAAYHHFAPLHDEKMQLVDEYPLTAQDPEGELATNVRATMIAQAKAQAKRRKASEATPTATTASSRAESHSGASTRDGDRVGDDLDVQNARPSIAAAGAQRPATTTIAKDGDPLHEGAGVENFHLVHDNTMLGTTFRQMVGLDRNIRHYRPPQYQGPDFTYREDDLDLPVDTDFVAVVCVLTSAYDMINEMQNLLTSMATANGYQRQLHEGSVAVDSIEKSAESIRSHRRKVFERYHNPELTGESRRPLSTIASPFHDFAV